MTRLKISCCIAAICLMMQFPAAAQSTATFTHTIKQGETVYSIARTYNVTPDAIIRLNPGSADGIKAGSTLIIPQQQAVGARYHTIQAGETLYRLTQLYKVSAEDICKLNPGLTAENFKVGMVVRIPSQNTVATLAAAENQTAAIQSRPQCREMHKVKRKETIYSIAKQYGLTEADLRNANPEMHSPDYKLKKGDFICIPYAPERKQAENQPSNAELIPQKAISPKTYIRMGVVLPLKGGKQENAKMLEFYRGLLLAVDSVKKAGVSVDVFAWHSGTTPSEITKLTQEQPLSSMDLIVGPLYADQIPVLNKYCQQHHVRLVVPFSSVDEGVYQNPLYYAVNAPKSFANSGACELTMSQFGKDNIVILNGGEKDDEATLFTDSIRRRYLSLNGKEAKTLAIDADDMTWIKAMNQFKTNVIIPNTSGVKTLNRLTAKLKTFTKAHPEYKIKLIGYPEWQTCNGALQEDFYKFDTYVYSSFFRNPLSSATARFEKKYQQTFHAQPLSSCPRFGMLGFDIGYYFLKGLSKYGDALEEHTDYAGLSPYQHRLTFRRVSNWSGFINREIQFIHYSPSRQIELIRLKQ